jgi:hypothetical protein
LSAVGRATGAFTLSLYPYAEFHIAVLFASQYYAIILASQEMSLIKNKPPRRPRVTKLVTKAMEQQRKCEQRIRNFDRAAIILFGLLALLCLSTYRTGLNNTTSADPTCIIKSAPT